jgi:hypothetical protein
MQAKTVNTIYKKMYGRFLSGTLEEFIYLGEGASVVSSSSFRLLTAKSFWLH